MADALDPNFKRTGFRLWGWFEEAGTDEAVYEPPHDAPCPYCFVPINANDVRTVSLMWQSPQYAKRSYFYRAHRTCANAAAEAGKPDEMDGRILDAIEKAGD